MSLPTLARPRIGLLDRLVALESGGADGSRDTLRAQLPYPFEAAIGSVLPDVDAAPSMREVHARTTQPGQVAGAATDAQAARPAALAPAAHGAPHVSTRTHDAPAAPANGPAPTSAHTTPVIERVMRAYAPAVGEGSRQRPPTSVRDTVSVQAQTPRSDTGPAQRRQTPALPALPRVQPGAAPPVRATPAAPALRPAPSIAQVPLAPQPTSEPVIEIHIGRLEVRGRPSPEVAPPQAAREPALRDDRLAGYLGRRTRGARS